MLQNIADVMVYVGQTSSVCVYRDSVNPTFVDTNSENRIVVSDKNKAVIFYHDGQRLVDIDWDASEVTLVLASTDMDFIEGLWGVDSCTPFEYDIVIQTIEKIKTMCLNNRTCGWNGFVMCEKTM